MLGKAGEQERQGSAGSSVPGQPRSHGGVSRWPSRSGQTERGRLEAGGWEEA